MSTTSSPPKDRKHGSPNWLAGGFLEETCAAMLQHVLEHAERGNPASIISTLDEFSRKMMNVGKEKGEIVDAEVRKKKPTIMVELGAFVGYSAVRFGALQRELADGKKSHYYSFEYNPTFADRTRQLVEFAGLSDQVTVITGAFADQCHILEGKTVDLYFIDHEKSVYLSDTKLIVESGTLVPGSLLVADNVLIPGAPDYLEYVENTPLFSTVRHEAYHGMFPHKDAISVATYLGSSSM